MTNSVRMDISGLTLRWSQVDAARFRAEGHWQDSTLVDTARAALAAEPEATLLIEGERRLPVTREWSSFDRGALNAQSDSSITTTFLQSILVDNPARLYGYP